MRRSTLLLFIRLILAAGVFFSVLFIIISLLPFETFALVLNKFARDGSFASFTKDHYQILARFLILGGTGILAFSGSMLIWWTKVQMKLNLWAVRFNEFWSLLRQDAQAFIHLFSFDGRERYHILMAFGLVFIAAVMRLAALFIPMQFDEAYTYNVYASQSLWRAVSAYDLPNNHVLLTILINLLIHLFGNQLWLIRLPSMIAGLLMIPASYFLAEIIYDKEAAILSAVFVGMFPILVEYSVLARGYILVSLLTLSILLLGDYVRRNKNRFAWLILIVSSALGFYTIPIMLFPFSALYLWLLLACIFGDTDTYRSKLDFITYWLASGFATGLLTAALYTPILLNPSNRFFSNKFIAPVGWDTYPKVLWFGLQGTWTDWTSSIPAWIVVLGVVGLMLSFFLHRRIAKHKIPMQIAFLVSIIGLLIIRRPDMESRMWTFMAAPLLIWSAGGFMGALKILSLHLKTEWSSTQIFSGVVLMLALITSLLTIPTIPGRWEKKGSVESAVIYLKSHLQEGDLVSSSTDFKPIVQYYFTFYGVPSTYLHQEPFQRAYVLVRSVNWSPSAGDTLEVAAPHDNKKGGVVEINVATAKVLQQYEDLALYVSYPRP